MSMSMNYFMVSALNCFDGCLRFGHSQKLYKLMLSDQGRRLEQSLDTLEERFLI